MERFENINEKTEIFCKISACFPFVKIFWRLLCENCSSPETLIPNLTFLSAQWVQSVHWGVLKAVVSVKSKRAKAEKLQQQ